MRFSFAVAIALSLGACVGVADRVSYAQFAARLEYQGFSFDRPPNSQWYMLHSEETHTSVTLRREASSATHTFYASVSLGGLERQPQTREEFFELAKSTGQTARHSVREISRDQEPTTIQDQWCLRLDTVAIAHGAPPAPDQDLQLVVRGYRCLHPAYQRTTLDFFYSERGLPGEIDPELAEEGEQFLRGVRIDVGPGKPAG